MRRARPLVLLLAGWALLLAAWAGANPPFAAPDETAHYSRAIEVGGGELIGEHAPEDVVGVPFYEVATLRETTYRVRIPGGLQPASAGCFVHDPKISAACGAGYQVPPEATVISTHVGDYQPLPYVAVGLAERLGHDPFGALRLGRAAAAVGALLLLSAAGWLVFDGSAISLAGLLLAATPMTLYVGSIVSGSGLEVAAGIAFAAALLRLARDGARRAAWVLAAVSGAVLALSRSLGVLWLALDLVWFAALVGPRAGGELLRREKRFAIPASATLILAVVLNRVWEALYGQHVPVGLVGLRHAVRVALEAVPGWWDQLIGRFGYLEMVLPIPLLLLWGLAVIALVVLAARLARGRERVVVLALAAGALVVLPVALQSLSFRFTGFGLQARHFLGFAVAVPLLAGDIVTRHAMQLDARVRRVLPLAAGTVAGVVQFGAWWFYARRSAVGVDGPFAFLGKAEWTPWAGWGLWLAFALVGSLLLAAAPLLSRRLEQRPRGG